VAEQQQAELSERRTEDLNLRGLLSPNGGDRVVPMELGPSLVPALEWLIVERDALLPVVQAARAWRRDYRSPLGATMEFDTALVAAVDAYEAQVDAGARPDGDTDG
jgi:hypothetical protein